MNDEAQTPLAAQEQDALSITFIRTSCLLLQYGGKTAITDPWFGRTMRGLPVFRKPGVPLDQLPRIDYVIASHLHRDHFDRDAVSRFGHPALEIAGTVGTARYCEGLPVASVHDMGPWDRHQLGPFSLCATPALHTGPPPAEVNFVIECGELRVFFGGDARWSDAYRSIAERFPRIDIAILPIGGTLIFGHRTTMAPVDAARACEVLRPRWAVPIHEGGEWLPVPPASFHPGRNRHFVRELERSPVDCEPCVIAPGETVVFTPSGARRG